MTDGSSSHIYHHAFALLHGDPLGVTFAHREKDRLLFAIERDADAMHLRYSRQSQRDAAAAHCDLDIRREDGGHVIVVDNEGVALLDTDNRRARPQLRVTTRDQTALAACGRRDPPFVVSAHRIDLFRSAVAGSGAVGVAGAVRISYRARRSTPCRRM